MPEARRGVWGCSLRHTLPALGSHLLVAGEAEAKQCAEGRRMHTALFRRAFFIFSVISSYFVA